MGVGPLVTAVGLALFLRLDADVDYVTDLLPALLVFSLGLSMTVAPLTATVLADADEHNAGVASGVNNAIARVAGLVAIAAVGAVVAASYELDARGEARAARAAAGAGRGGGRRQARAAGAGAGRGVPPAPSAAGRAGRRGRLGRGLPPGHGHRGGARGARRAARPDRHPEPAPRGGGARCPGGQLVGVPEEGARSRHATGAGEPAESAAPA